ncbi:MAG: TetR/AcrR family transcriptional regulator [Actinomycetota bacterium]|nr:TetR/AcrR family transcriptional regulator [Actinomycetota bacterium]
MIGPRLTCGIATQSFQPDQADPPQPLGRREQNKADKYRRIADAANTLFRKQGFEATTTAAIAEAAGIGAGTLYLYVTSKEDLLVDVFRHDVTRAWDEAFDRTDPEAPLLDQLLAAFLHVTDHHEDDRELARSFFKELLFVEEPVRSKVSEIMQGYFSRLGRLIEEAKRRDKVDPAVSVTVLVGNLFASWYITMQRRHTGAITIAQAKAQLEASFATALMGITPETSSR